MPLDPNEILNLQTAIRAALKSRKLDNWQTRFISDMGEKITRYGVKTRLSPKQEAKLRQIVKPYLPPDNVRQFTPKRQSGPRPVSPPRYNSKRQNRKAKSVRVLRKPRRRRIQNFWALGIIVVVALLFQVTQNPSGPSSRTGNPLSTQPEIGIKQELNTWDFSVTDGDTIRLRGSSKGTRLIGFNTPETFEPVCEQGLKLGRAATQRLKDLVAGSELIELEIVPCACRGGTQGTNECNYGRSCGQLSIDGIDVGSTLISEGLAARFICGRTSCPPTPRPWCN